MSNKVAMSRFSLQYWAHLTRMAFKFASEHIEFVEPVFNEAAEGGTSGDGSGPLSPGSFEKGILPGFLDNYMADNTSNRMLKMERKNARAFSQQTLQTVHIH